MNNSSTFQSYFNTFYNKYIKVNYKIIVGLLVLTFFLFLAYQYYSYTKLKNVHNNSIAYYDAKNLDSENEFYKHMERLSLNKDFYSIISKLEMININLNNNNFSLAEELYLNLLQNKNIKPPYLSAIASHASYQFLNFLFENYKIDLIPIINNFISYINDKNQSYKGIKLELKYLLAIADQDNSNISTLN